MGWMGHATVMSLEPWIHDQLKPILYSNRAELRRHVAGRTEAAAPRRPGQAERQVKSTGVHRRAQSWYSSRRRTQDWPWPSSSRPFGTKSM